MKVLSRNNLARIINYLKVNSIIDFGRGAFIKDLRVLAYHRICDPEQWHDNDISLVSASNEEFDWQVQYVKKHYDLISFEDLNDILNNKVDKPKRPVIITFDDGFSDNYFNAYPVLKEHSAKATFFVSADYIGTDKQYWFNKIYRSFINPQNTKVSIKNLNINIDFSNAESTRRRQIYTVIEALKKCPNHERLEYIEYIAQKYPERELDDRLSVPMTWDQLREMNGHNMEIGSHTTTHPVLSKLSDVDLKDEIHGSKKIIEEELNTTVSTIAYPVGMSFAYNDAVVSEVKAANYTFGASYIAGTNYLSELKPYDLRRIHVERYTTRSMFKAMLSFPEIFSVY
ncbi:MAG TPA: hypothetical protein ENJ08_01460 [Gammaproteobacteria bacterium]|nr:hypothetical protein [Gammaproteobacteria bacterium]